MPKVVDHELRRTDIARAALGVIAQKGLVATTMRDVALAASCSTGMVNHYFVDKDALLLATAKLAVDDLLVGFLSASADAAHGPWVLRQQLLSTVPASDEVRASHKVVVHLYAGALHSPELAEHVRTLYGVAISEITATLERGQLEGWVLPAVDPTSTAQLLLAAVDGLGIQALVDMKGTSPTGLATLIDQLVSSVVVPEFESTPTGAR
jgi:AcrR family transcriptional regulator